MSFAWYISITLVGIRIEGINLTALDENIGETHALRAWIPVNDAFRYS
jgi:hypothetical protein